MIEDILKDLRELRNEMVQANWPAQRLSNIILKYEMKLQNEKSKFTNDEIVEATNKILKVVLSVGDDSGIGPEIILKALCSNEIPENIDFILVGSRKNLQNTYKYLRSLGLDNLANPKNLKIHDIEISSSKNKSKSSYGNSSFYYLKKAIEIVKQYPNSALVTGPICKKSWSLAGHYFSGQTEVLAKACGVKNVGMLFTAKSPITSWRFNTLLATTHIAHREVPKK